LQVQRVAGDAPPTSGQLWRLSDEGAAQRTAREIEKLANYDSLTGLPNRALFRDRLQQAMLRARRHSRPMALMFLDLDRFKLVNDSLGHAVGDALLRHVADKLSASLRETDVVSRGPLGPSTVSRLGGDEFTVILEDLNHSDDAALVARRMLDVLAVPFTSGEEEIVVSASIGISMYPTDDVDLDGLLRHTDMAMYRSKSLGRNTFCFFSDELDTEVQSRLSLEGSLRRAVEHNEFVLHYQPKACLQTGRITGVEALLRWNCPGKGMVAPDRFIPVLEDTGLILPVGAWVIRRALEELEQWDQMGLPPITMAVNLSARQLRQQFLTAMVSDNLQQRGVLPARLELELTESLLMEDTEVTRSMLDGLGKLGVRLAIDDFGTGHSSLSYLRRFQVDTLKIDRSFVSETPSDPEACSVATAIVALGKSLGMKLVAEGVETYGQAEFLRGLGANEAQGWLISRPMPLHDLVAWFRRYDGERRAGRSPVLPHTTPADPHALVDLRFDADQAATA
jgi:diguanylate cyclase (GGDEF)-like protein